MRLQLLDLPSRNILAKLHCHFEIVDENPDIYYTQLTPITTDKPVFCPCTGTDHVSSPEIHNLSDKKWLSENIFSTAEHTLALLLAIAKNIPYHVFEAYNYRDDFTPMSMDLYTKHAMVVGYGRVGKQVGGMLYALGMQVGYTNDPNEAKRMLNVFDVITFHIPLNESTVEMVNDEWFSRMKEGTIVLNTSRAGIFNESDVFKHASRLRFGLDTAEGYSPVTLAAIEENGGIITPHVGGYSEDSREKTDEWIADRMIEYANR